MHAFDPDREILRLCANGEMNAAAHWLTHRYRKAIYRYCCRELRDAALAEDVCQHIFIVAYRDLGRFERRSPAWTWLFAIARHCVVNAARARARWEERTVELAEIADVHDPRPSPPESLDARRLLQLLRARVAELPEKTRTALLLRYQQGFTFEESAMVCDELPGTLQARVTRALRQLRATIESRQR